MSQQNKNYLYLHILIQKNNRMKKILLSFLIAGIGTITYAQPPAGDAKPGEWYGEKISYDGAVPIAEIVTKLEAVPNQWIQKSKLK